MKRRLGLILRILIAIAGITFIAMSVTWHDSVTLPKGFEVPLPEGASFVMPQKATFAVTQVDARQIVFDVSGQGSYRLKNYFEPLAYFGTVTLSREAFGPEPDQARFDPSITTMLTEANGWLLILGFLLTGLVWPIQAARWLMLMRCRAIDVTFLKSFRLTLVGLFFNFCMPGSTGGDLVKAYYAAKGSTEKPRAVMSVVFDRIMGLVSMLFVAAVAGALLMFDPDAPAVMQQVTLWLWGLVIVLVVGGCLYFSRGSRRTLGLDRILRRWPEQSLIRRVDDAAHAYRHHTGVLLQSMLLSAVAQGFLIAATIAAGWAIGMNHGAVTLAMTVPVLLIVGAAPLTYQGLGIMEGLGLVMLESAGLADSNQIIGMLLLLRVYQIGYGLIGAMVMMKGNIHLHPQDSDNSVEHALASREHPAVPK